MLGQQEIRERADRVSEQRCGNRLDPETLYAAEQNGVVSKSAYSTQASKHQKLRHRKMRTHVA
jgi:hypothetical protein